MDGLYIFINYRLPDCMEKGTSPIKTKNITVPIIIVESINLQSKVARSILHKVDEMKATKI